MSELCFTGQTKADKIRYKKLAETAGFIVRSGVTKNLDYLVCGKNAGKAKVPKAIEQGVTLIYGEEEFMQLLGKEKAPKKSLTLIPKGRLSSSPYLASAVYGLPNNKKNKFKISINFKISITVSVDEMRVGLSTMGGAQ
jgi:hypothetical protein